MSDRFGLSRWRRWGFERAARDAYRELCRRDRNILIADFGGKAEPLLMVFAKGQRAEDARRLLAPLLDPPARSDSPSQTGETP